MNDAHRKSCTKCGETKDATAEFWNRHKLGLFGLNPVCKTCRKRSEAIRRSTDGHKAKQKQWRADHEIQFKESIRTWVTNNRERKSALDRDYRERNREHVKQVGALRYQNNRERIDKANEAWAKSHPGAASTYNKRYSQKFPERILERVRRYQAAKLNRTPKWLTRDQQEEMRGFYKYSLKMFRETGIPHHVDHIVPLQGKTVSGFHVPWNLQVLEAVENIRKNCKFSADTTESSALQAGGQILH